MDYKTFRKWQACLPEGVIRLDDLNIYDLSLFSSLEPDGKRTIDAQDWMHQKLLTQNLNEGDIHCIEGLGVRDLLSRIFRCIRDNLRIKTVALPEDVYPVYFEIAADYFTEIKTFKTYPDLDISTVQDDSIVLLLPNPLTPVGRYLSAPELRWLENWLALHANRHILIDACYNFSAQYLVKEFASDRLVELVSVSKLWLKPAARGWALSRGKYAGFESMRYPALALSPTDLPERLIALFESAWEKVDGILEGLSSLRHPPESGYLSLVKMEYGALLTEHNIAAAPVTVFGSDERDLSVISCLSLVKEALTES